MINYIMTLKDFESKISEFKDFDLIYTTTYYEQASNKADNYDNYIIAYCDGLGYFEPRWYLFTTIH